MAKRRATPGEPRRFIDAHVSYDGDECIFWPFNTSSEGYARITHDGKSYPAHRLMCELVNGPAPKAKLDAAHSCGNGNLGCVTPQHLRWATKKENMADCVTHGTNSAGEKNAMAKLSEATVAIIREVAQFATYRTLARYYGVNESQIGRIVKGQRWGSAR